MNKLACLCLPLLGFLLTGCSKKEESAPGSTEPGRAAGRGPSWSSPVQLAALRSMDQNNLKQIGIGMHNYHGMHNRLPPAAICDAQGKPLLSWRVAILPELDMVDLHRQFRLNEPWDSEHNKKLIPHMPKVYLLPGSGSATEGYTHYRVFASITRESGHNHAAMFEWPDPTVPRPPVQHGFSAIIDGTSNTIMVATADEAVTWTKPDELIYDPKKPFPKLGMFWKSGSNVLLGDGSVRFVSTSISERTLRAAITRAGDELISSDW